MEVICLYAPRIKDFHFNKWCSIIFPMEKCIMVFRLYINSSQSADLNIRIMCEVNGKNTKFVHNFVLGTHFLNRTQTWLSIRTSLYSYIHSFFCHFLCCRYGHNIVNQLLFIKKLMYIKIAIKSIQELKGWLENLLKGN